MNDRLRTFTEGVKVDFIRKLQSLISWHSMYTVMLSVINGGIEQGTRKWVIPEQRLERVDSSACRKLMDLN
jgi:hypothetical protein